MSITSGFFDSIEGDRTYSANDLSTIYEGIVTDGVVPGVGGCLQVSSASGMKVTVSTGKCIVRNKWLRNTNNYDITIDQSDTTPRIDVIVAELDETLRVVSLKAIKGTAAASPTEPVLTENQLALAAVRVVANTAVISETNITDKRVFVQMKNGNGVSTRWTIPHAYTFIENGIIDNLREFQNSGAIVYDVNMGGLHNIVMEVMIQTSRDETYWTQAMVKLPESFKKLKFSSMICTACIVDSKDGVYRTSDDTRQRIIDVMKLEDGEMYVVVNVKKYIKWESALPECTVNDAYMKVFMLASEEWNDISL